MMLTLCWMIVCVLALACGTVQAGTARSEFIENHCADCHDADAKKGGLDLTALKWDLTDSQNFATWVKVYDRVNKGEMPPAKEKKRPSASEIKTFTKSMESPLLAADQARIAKQGRATERRLNRYEYEETLRDLLSLPYLEVKEFLPEDTESHGFNKIGEALDVSHVQMARYLTAAEFALKQAIVPQVAAPEKMSKRYYTMEEREFFGKIKLEGPLNRRTFPLIGWDLQTNIMAQKSPRRPESTNQEIREKEAMAVVVSTYEPTEIRFGGFHAPVSGRYRLKFSAYSVWMAADYTHVSKGNRSEPVSIYAETPPRVLRKLGDFDAGPEPTQREFDVWLLAGETIRPDASRLFRSRPPNHKNPLATQDGMPGLALQWMEVEGPLVDEWPPAGHKLLFGDLPVKDRENITKARRLDARNPGPLRVEITSEHPTQDAERLLRRFMERAYRVPVQSEDVERFLQVFRNAQKAGYSFTDAMIASYTGVLSSPAFLYLQEKPGRLDDRAIADRLAYFLWNSPPDDTLRKLAARGELHRPSVLRKQTDRLLDDPRSRRFVNAFLDYWLELRLIAGTAPDTELYPDYQLDDLLVESMIGETQMFFAEMLKGNLPVKNLVSSDFAMLNERLARHYGIPGVEGVDLRRVSLPANTTRGGLLTQASVLKVTANGTTTSPVKRGAWIMARLLGKPSPPPPASVQAVEPDTRGATTIREQLAKHRNQESCAVCHRNIDPAGFALEAFDVMGAERQHYRSLGDGERVKGIGHNGIYYHFRLAAQPIDVTGELPDGRPFHDIGELKQLLAKGDEQLARNLTQQLAIYATGAGIQFSDRPLIEKILTRSRSDGYGARTLVHEIVQSDLFLKK